MDFFSVAVVVGNLLLIAILVFFVYKPLPLKWGYINVYYGPEYGKNEDESPAFELSYNGYTGRVYIMSDSNTNTTLTVWFHGGSFLQDKIDTTADLWREITNNTETDLMVFDYPTLFNYTIEDTLKFANLLLTEVSKMSKYRSLILAGDSAGAFITSLLANANSLIESSISFLPTIKELQPIVGIISCFGWYGKNIKQIDDHNTDYTSTNLVENDTLIGGLHYNPWLYVMWSRYALKNISEQDRNKLVVSNFTNNTIPVLIMTSKQCFLYPHSKQLHFNCPYANYVAFDCDKCVHDFIFSVNIDEIEEATNSIIAFINNSTNTVTEQVELLQYIKQIK